MASALLQDRRVILISGEDRLTFLQGLVSNDVTLCTPIQGIWAALLSPKGRYQADFFISAPDGTLALDIDMSLADIVITRLKRFILRAKVEISVSENRVIAGWDEEKPREALCDPRLPEAGWRQIIPASATDCKYRHTQKDYEAHCMKLGLPGIHDFEVDETLLLEANFDFLNGISWTKGCYTGQEVTARMRYRGGVKKRLIPVSFKEGAKPPPCGTVLLTEDGQEAGKMRSSINGRGLALLRIAWWDQSFTHNGMLITPSRPFWMKDDKFDL